MTTEKILEELNKLAGKENKTAEDLRQLHWLESTLNDKLKTDGK